MTSGGASPQPAPAFNIVASRSRRTLALSSLSPRPQPSMNVNEQDPLLARNYAHDDSLEAHAAAVARRAPLPLCTAPRPAVLRLATSPGPTQDQAPTSGTFLLSSRPLCRRPRLSPPCLDPTRPMLARRGSATLPRYVTRCRRTPGATSSTANWSTARLRSAPSLVSPSSFLSVGAAKRVRRAEDGHARGEHAAVQPSAAPVSSAHETSLLTAPRSQVSLCLHRPHLWVSTRSAGSRSPAQCSRATAPSRSGTLRKWSSPASRSSSSSACSSQRDVGARPSVCSHAARKPNCVLTCARRPSRDPVAPCDVRSFASLPAPHDWRGARTGAFNLAWLFLLGS
jgi:hypothetical protein